MKQRRRKLIASILIIVFQVTSVPGVALAQDASSSADVQGTTTEASSSAEGILPVPQAFTSIAPTPTSIPTPQLSEDAPSQDAVPTPFDGAIQSLNKTTDAGASAGIAKPAKMRKLAKRTFKAQEDIMVMVDNPDDLTLDAVLLSADGEEVPYEVQKMGRGYQALIRVVPPSTKFRPGKYTLQITDSRGNVSEQDFTWGVLALNTNKSIYLPKETAHIAMVVLDEQGEMVCDAKVELRIQNQEFSIDDVLSTENGQIKVNPTCTSKEFTLEPDYESTYIVGDAGNYDVTLTAETRNGTYSITDAIVVQEKVAFDIERTSATRLYPPHTYPMLFTITAQEDFEGTITEVVPDTFLISPVDSNKNLYKDVSSYDRIERVSYAEVETEQILGASVTLGMPIDAKHEITSLFGSKVDDPLLAKKYFQYGLAGHDGIDFDVPIGTPVYAVDDGEAVLTEIDGDYGTTLVLEHSFGKSYYGHLSKIAVRKGEKVKRGDTIALTGDTGLSTGPHLHFGIKPTKHSVDNGFYGKVDPLPYLGLQEKSRVLGAATTDEDVQVLTWEVSLKKGETIQLGYYYKSPARSPEFYKFGPLQFFKNGKKMIFEESRQWQLALDATESKWASSHLTGSFSNPTNAVGSTTGTWAGDLNTNTNYTSRWAMEDPSGSITGTQTINILARKGSNSGTPKLQVNLYENGALVQSVIATTNITSTTGQTISGTFNASAVSNPNNVEIEVVQTGAGGSPSARNSAQIDTIEWVVNLSAPAPVVVQHSYRWRLDDGNETGGSSLVAQNTAYSGLPLNSNIRLRFTINNSGSAAATNYQYRLEYAARDADNTCDGDETYAAVPDTATTQLFEMTLTSNYADGASSTNVTTGPGVMTDPSSSTFVAGKLVEETSNTTAAFTVNNGQFTEIEYNFKANSNASYSTSYCFRLTNAGTALNTYSVYPTVTTSATPPSNLTQYDATHATYISTGGTTTDGESTNIYLNFDVSSSDTTETLTPKVEVRDTATSFTNSATHTGSSALYKPADPVRRRQHSAIYDSANKRMIIFGGVDKGNTYYNDVWELKMPTAADPKPQWRLLNPTGTKPVARYAHTAIYDELNQRMIMFGGYDGNDNNDVWELTLPSDGDGAWTQLSPSGTSPAVRSNTDAIYDPDNDRMVVFGGWGASRYNDVWELTLPNGGTPAWAQLSPTGTAPSIRGDYCAAYDSTNNDYIIFGGWNGSSYFNDVYKVSVGTRNSEAWTQLSPAGTAPSVRGHCDAIYDSANSRFIVYGGWNGTTRYSDIFELTLSSPAWTEKSPDIGERHDATRSHSGIYDPENQRMVEFGGQDGSGEMQNYVIAIDLPSSGSFTYKQMALMVYLEGRDAQGYVWDSDNNRMVIFGGWGRIQNASDIQTGGHINEVWGFTPSDNTWRDLNRASTGPLAREGVVWIYDSANDRFILFSGLVGQDVPNKYYNDVWEFKLSSTGDPTWRKLSPSGTKPGERWLASGIYDSANQRMIIFGGEGGASGGTDYNDVWALSLPSSGDGVWTQLSPTGTAPSARGQAAMIYDSGNQRMILFGGGNVTGAPLTYSSEVWSLSLTSGSEAWTQISASGPSARRGATCLYDNAYTEKRMVCFGGYDGTNHYNDVWKMNVTTPGNETWAQITPSGTAPVARRSHGSVYDPVNQQMIMYAGRGSTPFYNDTWILSLQESTASWAWTEVSHKVALRLPVAVTGLTGSGTQYHWQAWATGSVTGDTSKAAYGGNSDTVTADADFQIGVGGPTNDQLLRHGKWFNNSGVRQPFTF